MTVSEEKSNSGSVRATFRLISSRLKDGAPFIFYFTLVLIAMAGWLYFIGRLLWEFAGWMFS
ncbi:MAG TPA: hypothetical protein VHB49_26115 [Bradyrhizobium sp.]|nr:hypothetical protein [Bradyrhizobium sp.]